MNLLSSWSIRKKLLFLIFVAVLPALGIILFSGIEHRENEIVSTKRDIMHLVQSLAAQQEQVAAGTRQMLQTLAQLPEVQGIDTIACNRIFRDIHAQNQIYSTISAATPDGNMFAASAPFTPGSVNLADRKHIRDAIRTREFSAGESIVGRVSRVPSINYTYPVLDKNGKLIAVVIAGIKLDKYKEFMAQVNLPKGSVMGIEDHKNETLYRFPEHEIIPPGTSIPSKKLQGIPVDSKEGFYEGIGSDNVSRIYAYKRLWLRTNEPPYLGIFVGVDKNMVLRQANIELAYNLAFLGIACFLAMLLAWRVGKSIIVNPIDRLVIATQRFGKGAMHIRTDLPPREDELGRLAESFDAMAAMLEREDLERKRAEEALRESEERWKFALEGAGDGLWDWDAVTNQVFFSKQWKAMLGLAEEDIDDTLVEWERRVHPEDKDAVYADIERHFRRETEVYQSEHRVFCKDGSYKWILDRGKVIEWTEDGKPRRVIGTHTDITRHKQAEKEVIETLQQLHETRDMMIQIEKHAAVGRLSAGVAHEILNPASVISSRLQFLEEEDLSESSRENVRVSREQLERIVKISRDLHQYAVEQQGMHVGGDLRRVIEVGLHLTERWIKEDHVQVEYDPPAEVIPVKMERDRVVKVMVNLIINACTAMTGNQLKRLIINIDHREDSSKVYSVILTISDNGQGIPAGDLSKIFEPFFTTKDPGKGTGLGLSVCKGIIHEHGGTIHAENNDMGGASFIVELPLYHS